MDTLSVTYWDGRARPRYCVESRVHLDSSFLCDLTRLRPMDSPFSPATTTIQYITLHTAQAKEIENDFKDCYLVEANLMFYIVNDISKCSVC